MVPYTSKKQLLEVLIMRITICKVHNKGRAQNGSAFIFLTHLQRVIICWVRNVPSEDYNAPREGNREAEWEHIPHEVHSNE